MDNSNNYFFRNMPSKYIEDMLIVSDTMGYIYSPDFHLKRETFNNYLILYVCDGVFHIHQHGKKYSLTKNQGVMMSLRDAHEYYSDKQNVAKIMWFHFRGSCIEPVMMSLQNNNLMPLIFSNNDIVTNTPYKIYPSHVDINSCFMKLFQLNTNKPCDFDYQVSSEVYKAVIDIAKIPFTNNLDDTTQLNSWFCDTIIDYINNNIYKKISLQDLSDCVGFNLNYFNKVFKKYFNTSPHKLILDRKALFSIDLLIYSNQSIGDISYSLSFADQSHYNKVFKNIYGISPLKYRKMYTPK